MLMREVGKLCGWWEGDGDEGRGCVSDEGWWGGDGDEGGGWGDGEEFYCKMINKYKSRMKNTWEY